MNVKQAPYNAVGDGTTDDTAAIQAAVNAVGGTGGTVLVTNGVYMINALQSVQLKSDMTFLMSTGAVLQAIPNGADNYGILKISYATNVNVVGGILKGDRTEHTGTTGEGGMGLDIQSSQNVVVEGVTARECWGDGLYVGGTLPSINVTFCNVVSDHNRRQGMSITSANGVTVRGSVFVNTAGTPPECGIDVEPNLGQTVANSLITGCTFTNNAGGGIALGPSEANMATTFVTNLIVERNTILRNGVNALDPGTIGGIRLSACTGNTLRSNLVDRTTGVGGIAVLNTTAAVVTGNTVTTTITPSPPIGREDGSGIVLEQDRGTLCSLNVITNNAGSGIFTYMSNATITNNTVFGNDLKPQPPFNFRIQ